MRLKNSTDWPDWFVRRMLAWCCREIGYPIRQLHEAQIRNRSRGHYSGHAYYGGRRIVVSIGPETFTTTYLIYERAGVKLTVEECAALLPDVRRLLLQGNTINGLSTRTEKATKTCWPTTPDSRPGMQGEVMFDRLEALVAVAAHEIYHLAAHFVEEHRQRTRGSGRHFASSERHTRVEEVRVLRLFRANREALVAEWNTAPASPAKPAVPVQERRAAKAANDLARWQRKFKLAQTKIRKLKVRVRYYERQQATAAARS